MLKQILSGNFNAVYIDLSINSTPLVLIPDLIAGPINIEISQPTRYSIINDADFQAGLYTVSFTLSFYGQDENVYNIAKGQALNTDSNNPFIHTNRYSVLLLSTDETQKNSFYFSSLKTATDELGRRVVPNFDKENPTQISVPFQAFNRNANTVLYTKNTYTNLAAIMGSKAPF